MNRRFMLGFLSQIGAVAIAGVFGEKALAAMKPASFNRAPASNFRSLYGYYGGYGTYGIYGIYGGYGTYGAYGLYGCYGPYGGYGGYGYGPYNGMSGSLDNESPNKVAGTRVIEFNKLTNT